MFAEIFNQALIILQSMLNKTLLCLSVIISIFLGAIGYPKQVLVFILVLIVIDLITKQASLVVMKYGEFSIHNYLKGWTEKPAILTSRALKNGVCVKTILYSPVLYMAHQFIVIPQMIGGSIISNTFYTLLILVETSSIFENFIASGFAFFKPFLKYIKNKKNEVIETNKNK
ncbi:phage holin family protein [Clostridium sp. FP2]|uniref:phage holin family protein n=1 Tax=Clostridium sp. FP2 TaxID=2724481 RepID=UPI0013E999A1|nr:phage holin family protein [Clostridium sp. FP2]MBZ9622829.1 phage holin family protein [Clostridium sp. FP2]